jgi:3-(3-hydroxy-phenyl)propionate hydroxylase
MEMLARNPSADSPSANATDIPMLTGGLLTDTLGSGELLPQPIARLADGREGRLDDLLSNTAWLITRTPLTYTWDTSLSIYELGRDIIDDGTLAAWLDQHHSDVVLVRPDRYVFGTGDPQRLAAQWFAGLRGKLPNASGGLEYRATMGTTR